MTLPQAQVLFALAFPILNISNQELVPFLISNESKAAIALPGVNILFDQGTIRPKDIASKCQSYINAILI